MDSPKLARLIAQGEGQATFEGRLVVHKIVVALKPNSRIRVKFISARSRPRQCIDIFPRRCKHDLEWGGGVAKFDGGFWRCWFDTMPSDFDIVIVEAEENPALSFQNGEEHPAAPDRRLSWGGNNGMNPVLSNDRKVLRVNCNGFDMKREPDFKDLIFEVHSEVPLEVSYE